MKNKILILLMSCNQPLYLSEEQACRDTFLKVAEGANIPFYFYRGGEERQYIDTDHVMHLNCPDGLGGTSEKTVLAMAAALQLGEWDYLIKTNVSTWLNIGKISDMINGLKGKDDVNIYGARFIANEASKKVPFPRGHFIILSRTLVEGIVKFGPILAKADGMPKTDDTLLCLALLYYIQKTLGDNYQKRLMEVPSVIEWTDAIQDSREWTDALSIRCKDERSPENTPENMRRVNKIKRAKNQSRTYRRSINLIETKYGLMPYDVYSKVSTLLAAVKKELEENKAEIQRQKKELEEKNMELARQQQPQLNKIEEIKRKLLGK